MQVNTYRRILSLAILVIIAVTVLILLLRPQPSGEAGGETPVQSAYYLREYEDKIGVFRPEETEPFMMIDVFVSTLPSADQLELRTGGIRVADDRKLQSMLEDFGS